MEICFIPDKDYVGWLSRRGELPGPGDFVFHGEVVGRHEGIARYTVGQRRPGLIDGRKIYISRIDAKTNRIELALWEELFKTEVLSRDFNWLIEPPVQPIRASVRVRHTKWETPACTVYPQGDRVRIVCDEPVRAPAAGQAAALYDGERLIGGGTIMTDNGETL
jgi:tRNA-specific 2-thiouridylase